MRSHLQEPEPEPVPVPEPVKPATEKKRTSLFPTYMSLLYSFIHPMIGLYAILLCSDYYKYLGLVVSCIYYVYATIVLRVKYKNDGFLSREDWLSVAHHVVTLFALGHFWWDLDFLNVMFTVAIASNIFLYIAYINEKKKLWFGRTRLNILTIETVVYILCRIVIGAYYLYAAFNVISWTLYGAVLLVFGVSSWWSYRLIRGLRIEYARYKLDIKKKTD